MTSIYNEKCNCCSFSIDFESESGFSNRLFIPDPYSTRICRFDPDPRDTYKLFVNYMQNFPFLANKSIPKKLSYINNLLFIFDWFDRKRYSCLKTFGILGILILLYLQIFTDQVNLKKCPTTKLQASRTEDVLYL